MFGVHFKALFFSLLSLFFPPNHKPTAILSEQSALGLIACVCARGGHGKVKIAQAAMGNSWVQFFQRVLQGLSACDMKIATSELL